MKIYLINQSNSNLYKIGITGRNSKARKNELQVANGYDLNVILEFETKHNRTFETAMHRRYHNYHTRGEWFELSDEQVLSFIENCKIVEKNLDYLAEHNTYLQQNINFLK
jgi:nicotinic acid phosphoribosyltransferase